MPIEILMPALSPTMTEGNLARWLKKEGDEVHAGDVIAEIETDKATMEYEAVDEGRIGKIIVPEGAQGIKVNQPIAVLLEEGEDDAALADVGSAGRPAAPASRREVNTEAGETGAAPLPSGPIQTPPPAPRPDALPAPMSGKGPGHRGYDLRRLRDSEIRDPRLLGGPRRGTLRQPAQDRIDETRGPGTRGASYELDRSVDRRMGRDAVEEEDLIRPEPEGRQDHGLKRIERPLRVDLDLRIEAPSPA